VTRPRLPAPPGLTAESGRGQVTMRWRPVPGAAGYVPHRAERPEGPFQPIRHHGGGAAAVPGCCYADTGGRSGVEAWYAAASLAEPDGPPGPLSAPAAAAPQRAGAGAVELAVDVGRSLGTLPRPWRTVGSEHLSLLLRGRDERGFDVGVELAEALRIAALELGADRVRAHGVLLDELGVYREGRLDFSGVDRVYDHLRWLGLRPLVELGFMPRDLAADPSATLFDYGAIVSPPRDWAEWGRLVEELAAHLVERYGIGEVASWGFEVWNEPNLSLFWTGDQAAYLRLYEVTARALKSVDARLRVGGPATAGAGWIADFARFACRQRVPVDFLSTHGYGGPPLDVAATAHASGLAGVPVWWTEWGVSQYHFAEVNDLVFGAPFVLGGMAAALGRAERLATWVVSDHFEEVGSPPSLFHGGFGLLTVGNLRKPRFWALRMLQLLGRERVEVELEGDGAGSLVQALAARDRRGGAQVLVWNGALDQAKRHGDDALRRRVRVCLRGLEGGRYRRSHHRVDHDHSNVLRAWEGLGAPDWPDADGWARLRAADRLEELEPACEVEPVDGGLSLELELPMPGASLIRLVPH
jgi:xylan 1,4-beta-xylosidase